MGEQPTQAYNVTVPAGLKPGDEMKTTIGGRDVILKVPAGAIPGQMVMFKIPVTNMPR